MTESKVERERAGAGYLPGLFLLAGARLSSGQKMTSKEQCPVSRFLRFLPFYQP
jgi:hypothetical protein